jgi:hypothetical protein
LNTKKKIRAALRAFGFIPELSFYHIPLIYPHIPSHTPPAKAFTLYPSQRLSPYTPQLKAFTLYPPDKGFHSIPQPKAGVKKGV